MNDTNKPAKVKPKTGIFVIAYNAEKHIWRTLSRIPADIWELAEVVYVADDCSTDDTVAKSLAYPDQTGKLQVIRNRLNRRYGGNQKLGYQFAIDRGLDIVVMLHGDGQYAPELLPDMLKPLVDDEADVVFGSRMMIRGKARKGGMPLYKYIGNIVLTRIENFFSGMNLSEFHSGYRAYRVDLLRKIPFWENSDEWHFDTHIIFQAKEASARIVEIPIKTYYGDEICHVNGIAYGLNCIFSAMIYWMFRRKIVYSRKYDVQRRGTIYTDKFDDPTSSHSIIWKWLQPLIGTDSRVLELGVGDASLTRRLHDAGTIIDGIEINSRAAGLAAPYCRTIRTGDLDQIDALLDDRTYDVVIAADVLEHLKRPQYVLSRLKPALREGGTLVVSLPNIANIYVRVNLLLGRFPTYRKGILDESHLHYYTLKAMRQLLQKTGWVIEREEVTTIPLAIIFPFTRLKPLRWVICLFHAVTRLLPGLLAYQGVFVCRNPNRADLL